jgi:putative ABC transport system substrate-binding protein
MVGACLIASSDIDAQQPGKLPRIGYLSTRDRASDASRREAIFVRLRELGYREGETIAVEYRYAEGKINRFTELANELLRLNVDMIVMAGGDLLVRAVVNTTKTVPLIMTGGGIDPVKAGFVKSLARPGGNVTGITNLTIELGGKRLELFKEAVPQLVRVAVIHDQSSTPSGTELKDALPNAARAHNMTIQTSEVRAENDFQKVFTAFEKKRPDGLYVSSGAFLNSNRQRIVDFALTNRFPSVYGRREYVTEGGLMYYGADITDSYKRVAYYIDRILKGAKPADLPVEQPTKFEFIVNLKTAKAIGVIIQPNVLARADRVIK